MICKNLNMSWKIGNIFPNWNGGNTLNNWKHQNNVNRKLIVNKQLSDCKQNVTKSLNFFLKNH